jgi:hypothetical protein
VSNATPGAFWESVYLYCRLLGGSVTSGPRSSKRNALVGGILDSPHVFGFGADVVYDDEPPAARRQVIAARLGLRLIVERGHDHLQPTWWVPGAETPA